MRSRGISALFIDRKEQGTRIMSQTSSVRMFAYRLASATYTQLEPTSAHTTEHKAQSRTISQKKKNRQHCFFGQTNRHLVKQFHRRGKSFNIKSAALAERNVKQRTMYVRFSRM